MSFPDVRSGQPLNISARWYNAVNRLLKNAPSFVGTASETSHSFSMVLVEVVSSEAIAASSDRKYTLKLLSRALDENRIPIDAELEVNGYSIAESTGDGTAIADGEVLLGFFGVDSDGESVVLMIPGGGGSLPTGQHQYQTLQVVADNQTGWDFHRAHPITA